MEANFSESIVRRWVLAIAWVALLVLYYGACATIQKEGVYLQIVFIVLLYWTVMGREFRAISTSIFEVI